MQASDVPRSFRTIGRPSASTLFRPGGLHERTRQQHFSGGAIEHVEQAVAIGGHDHLGRSLLQRNRREHRHLRRIPIVQIVRRELIVPAQLARVDVERDERARVQVVALAILSVVRGIRIARAIEHEIQIGVVAPRHPHTATALGHRFSRRPRFAAGLSRRRHGVETPLAVAGSARCRRR